MVADTFVAATAAAVDTFVVAVAAFVAASVVVVVPQTFYPPYY